MLPIADWSRLVANSGLPEPRLIEVGKDHRLADPKRLAALLRAMAV